MSATIDTRDKNMVIDILKWIWNNISAIKDIFWIIFTLIATVIAVLTYKRARYTILQPLRSEVIKRQTDLFIEIIEVFSDESKMLVDLDLDKIVTLNAFKVLEQYGYVLNGAEALQKECDKSFVGGLIVKRGNQLDMFEKPDAFNKSKQGEDKREPDFRKRLYENLEEEKIDIEMIYLTKKYYETMEKYKMLTDNAFLPKEIKEPLEEIIRNIYNDISINLKQILEGFVLEVYHKNKNGEKFSINPIGVYNDFNEKRHINSKLIEKVREETREYLMIDKKW